MNTTTQKKRILVTGAAGYVGVMLVEALAKRDDVEVVVGVDKEPVPQQISQEKKLVYIQANTSDDGWQEHVAQEKPTIVIHTAWQIRMIYDHPETTWLWNVEGSRKVFELAFSLNTERLIHFSTASIYGAYPSNTFEHRFTEKDPMREHEYLYGVEKKKAEEILKETAHGSSGKTKVAIIRPAAITGPRGRFQRVRFGLQSALSGQLKGGLIYPIISLLVSFVPATKGWVRQFIHEDDITDITIALAFDEWKGSDYEVYNATPNGAPVYAKDMARAVGKRIIRIMPWMARIAYFFFWHITRGKIPTAPGSWRFYSYPIVMDGTKLKEVLGYHCRMESYDAFRKTTGRYEYAVPEGRIVR